MATNNWSLFISSTILINYQHFYPCFYLQFAHSVYTNAVMNLSRLSAQDRIRGQTRMWVQTFAFFTKYCHFIQLRKKPAPAPLNVGGGGGACFDSSRKKKPHLICTFQLIGTKIVGLMSGQCIPEVCLNRFPLSGYMLFMKLALL